MKKKKQGYLFCVITKIPSEYEQGNWYDHVVEAKDIRLDFIRREDFVNFPEMFGIRMPVFEVVEILIVEPDYKREIGYPGRKPGKWNVDCEYFDTAEKAIKRAVEVMNPKTEAKP